MNKPKPKELLHSRERCLELGLCVVCQDEPSSENLVIGRACQNQFAAIDSRARRGGV